MCKLRSGLVVHHEEPRLRGDDVCLDRSVRCVDSYLHPCGERGTSSDQKDVRAERGLYCSRRGQEVDGMGATDANHRGGPGGDYLGMIRRSVRCGISERFQIERPRGKVVEREPAAGVGDRLAGDAAVGAHGAHRCTCERVGGCCLGECQWRAVRDETDGCSCSCDRNGIRHVPWTSRTVGWEGVAHIADAVSVAVRALGWVRGEGVAGVGCSVPVIIFVQVVRRAVPIDVVVAVVPDAIAVRVLGLGRIEGKGVGRVRHAVPVIVIVADVGGAVPVRVRCEASGPRSCVGVGRFVTLCAVVPGRGALVRHEAARLRDFQIRAGDGERTGICLDRRPQRRESPKEWDFRRTGVAIDLAVRVVGAECSEGVGDAGRACGVPRGGVPVHGELRRKRRNALDGGPQARDLRLHLRRVRRPGHEHGRYGEEVHVPE